MMARLYVLTPLLQWIHSSQCFSSPPVRNHICTGWVAKLPGPPGPWGSNPGQGICYDHMCCVLCHFPSLFCSSAQVVFPLIARWVAPGQVIKQQIKTPVHCCKGEASNLGTVGLAASQPGISFYSYDLIWLSCICFVLINAMDLVLLKGVFSSCFGSVVECLFACAFFLWICVAVGVSLRLIPRASPVSTCDYLQVSDACEHLPTPRLLLAGPASYPPPVLKGRVCNPGSYPPPVLKGRVCNPGSYTPPVLKGRVCNPSSYTPPVLKGRVCNPSSNTPPVLKGSL